MRFRDCGQLAYGRYWPTAAVAVGHLEATDLTVPDQTSERRDCARCRQSITQIVRPL